MPETEDSSIEQQQLNTNLAEAITANDYYNANRLIQEGADINAADDNMKPMLINSVELGNLDIVKLLLGNKNLDIEARDYFGENALINAIRFKHTNIALELLDSGINPDSLDKLATPAITSAVQRGLKEVVESILVKRSKTSCAQLEQVKYAENYALNKAINYGQEEIVILIIERAANLDLNLDREEYPLILSLEMNRQGIIEKLLEQKELNLNIVNKYGETPLMMASKADQYNSTCALLNRLYNEGILESALEQTNHLGKTARELCSIEIVGSLLESPLEAIHNYQSYLKYINNLPPFNSDDPTHQIIQTPENTELKYKTLSFRSADNRSNTDPTVAFNEEDMLTSEEEHFLEEIAFSAKRNLSGDIAAEDHHEELGG